MTNAQYSDICQSMHDLRDAVMRKEMGDDGWDLRDELLILQEVVSQLVTVVYQNRYVAQEPVRPVDPHQIRDHHDARLRSIVEAEPVPEFMVRIEYEVPPLRAICTTYFADKDDSDEQLGKAFLAVFPNGHIRKITRKVRPVPDGC